MNQSLRLTVEENKLVREASELERRSINSWAVDELVRAAKATIAAKGSKDEDLEV